MRCSLQYNGKKNIKVENSENQYKINRSPMVVIKKKGSQMTVTMKLLTEVLASLRKWRKKFASPPPPFPFFFYLQA